MGKDFEWDYEAAGNLLLRSEEIANFCEQEAERMTRATGMKYNSDVRMGKTRVRAMAQADKGDANIVRARKFDRDPITDWPICPKCGEAHYHCTCWRKKG